MAPERSDRPRHDRLDHAGPIQLAGRDPLEDERRIVGAVLERDLVVGDEDGVCVRQVVGQVERPEESRIFASTPQWRVRRVVARIRSTSVA